LADCVETGSRFQATKIANKLKRGLWIGSDALLSIFPRLTILQTSNIKNYNILIIFDIWYWLFD